MRNKSTGAIALIGFIIIAFTIAAFFLLEIEKIAVNIWALAFLLLSEIALFGGLIGLRISPAGHSAVFFRTGVSAVLTLYFGVTLVSVFFAGAFKEKVNTFIFIELAIIVLFSVALISVFAWSCSIARRNETDAAKVGDNRSKRGGF